MLNELFDLHRSMTEAEIPIPIEHKLYTECPRKQAMFKILVSPHSKIEDLEIVRDEEKRASIYKYVARNQGFSFPAFNVVPLLHAMDDKQRDDVKALKRVIVSKTGFDERRFRGELEHVWHNCVHLWPGSMTTRINRSLNEQGGKLQRITGKPPEKYQALEELIRRVSNMNAEQFAIDLKEIIARHVACSPSSQTVRDWIDTLLVTTAGTVVNKPSLNVTFAMELSDSYSFDYPALSPRIQQWISTKLLENELAREKQADAGALDAFGQSITRKDYEEKYLTVKVEVLGNVVLRSMFGASRCQKRYGRIESKSFAAGGLTQRQMGGALKWLGSLPQKKKTWTSASGASGYRQAVLYAYPSHLPPDIAEIPETAGLFGRDEEQDEEPRDRGASFSAAAARVIPSLQGIVREHPDTEIRVFVLARADQGRTKLLTSKRYEATWMIEAAQRWQDGCRNLPHIAIDIGKDEPIIRPYIPYPVEVVRCLNIAWLQEGTRVKLVHGLNIDEGITLLLGTGHEAYRVAQKSLQLVTSNAVPLLLSLGHADHRNDNSLKWTTGNGGTIKYAEHANLLLGILGLLLHKINVEKGGYMNNSPFLVGRMLALADILHKEYCRHERASKAPANGQDEKDTGMPRQLIGNAAMHIGLINPTDALSRLAERILIYQAWANTAPENKTGLAGWALGELGKVTEELRTMQVPKTCDDAAKVQVLLGYLARSHKKQEDIG
jgi:hypothetical protein